MDTSIRDSKDASPHDEREKLIHKLKWHMAEERTPSQKLADTMVRIFGNMGFLIANVLWFVIWIIWNTRMIPGLEPFDPFPFELLTTIVSLEAILLAIFVLISQNREAHVTELREETDLQLDILSEKEITKIMRMLSLLLEKQGIDISEDGELVEMLAPTDVDKIEEVLEDQIDRTKKQNK